jgi:uncharacterized damage-inducible protein DinB
MVGLAVLPLAAEELTQGERNRLLSESHATRKLFVDAISGLSEAQWQFKPGDGGWSIAEIAEHVAVTEDLYWNGIQRNVATDASPEKRAEIKVEDEAVIPRMVDRTSKRKAVEANTPTGRFADAAEVTAAYEASRERLIEYVRTTKDDLRNHVWPHRAYGPIDGYQWVLLACGHIERHVAQMNEVKASEGWPE